MEVGSSVPPLVVHEPSMTIIDGIHRLEAARRSGAECIRTVLVPGEWSVAFVLAVQANVSHGKPLTLAERRSAARTILGDFPDCSDRWLASVCGLAPSTVSGLRTSRPAGSTRVGRDGRRRPVDSGELRTRVAEAVAANPGASVRAIAAAVGASPSTVQGEVRRSREGPKAEDQHRQQRAGRTGAAPEGADPAMVAVPQLASFLQLLSRTSISDADWQPVIGLIPLGRIYEFADECRRRAHAWSSGGQRPGTPSSAPHPWLNQQMARAGGESGGPGSSGVRFRKRSCAGHR
jgi:ParB-like chromosome segregation protein Spo0J